MKSLKSTTVRKLLMTYRDVFSHTVIEAEAEADANNKGYKGYKEI